MSLLSNSNSQVFSAETETAKPRRPRPPKQTGRTKRKDKKEKDPAKPKPPKQKPSKVKKPKPPPVVKQPSHESVGSAPGTDPRPGDRDPPHMEESSDNFPRSDTMIVKEDPVAMLCSLFFVG